MLALTRMSFEHYGREGYGVGESVSRTWATEMHEGIRSSHAVNDAGNLKLQ